VDYRQTQTCPLPDVFCRKEGNKYFLKYLLAYSGTGVFYGKINIFIARPRADRDLL